MNSDQSSVLRFASGHPSAEPERAATAPETPEQPQPARHNLPQQLSSFVGRQRERAEVARLLATTRLLTLTGPGGCGKTRLALAVAGECLPAFEHGVWLTELAPLAEADLVPQAVAAALGQHEQPGRPLAETLADYARPRRLLLVIDNCEHLVAACARLVEALLRACPELHVLATSREPLGLPGETTWPVPPLSLPARLPWRSPASARASLAAYEQSEAVRLFAERARAAQPEFRLAEPNAAWVADICRRLDGMPLAIELAAARTRALSVEQIAERLDDRFRLLTGGHRTAPARHQTLAATLDWSYALLPAAEQLALQRLSVFAGGWGLPAAEAVCAGAGVEAADVLDLLARLVDKSLVVAERQDGAMRYHLQETIRQYAQRRLAEAGEEAFWRDRHLDYFVQWGEAAEPHLSGADKAAWLSQFEIEHDNLRAALAWSLSSAGKARQSLHLATLTGPFWRLHGYSSEGRARLAAALAQPGAEHPENAAEWVMALNQAATLAFVQSDYRVSRALTQVSIACCREMGAAGQFALAWALDILADVESEEGNYAVSRALFEQALALHKKTRFVEHTLTMLGWVAMRAGDYESAATRLDEALAHCRALGDPELIGQALAGRGELAVRQEQYGLARSLLEESLTVRRGLGEKWGIAISLGTLGWIALRQGDFNRMRGLLAESLAVRLDTGDAGGSAWCLEKLAEAALLEGQAAPASQRSEYFQRAATIFGAASALRARLNSAMDQADRPEFERNVAALRAGLGQDAFAAAWAAGGAMTLEQATDYALAEPEVIAAAQPLPAAEGAQPDLGGLTERERQVAALIAQGKSNRQIAAAMVVGVRTVETYVTRILAKLGLDSRVQIATWAIEKGLAIPQR